MDIYAPIANRLGISWIKTELEDLILPLSASGDLFRPGDARSSLKKQEREAFIVSEEVQD
jgi:GTP diphosphokinase / guanosine-3',5'-bis(diphosphate) 3'-diphosphatase